MVMPHPSPMFINRYPGNRDRVLKHLQSVADRLAYFDDQ
ncbi:hypothetical protein ATSB10_01500 [Dyella thiooxydans]|uniref:Uracil-DNA glycosylase n=2 Tax=Dyella thiooxydans TaxID=445710 RepID=A0A160MXB4_9GAMM|nr:hypothetical protein ATSB10_01500 [Dyella thiooxydans]